jgi:hypothetical protein
MNKFRSTISHAKRCRTPKAKLGVGRLKNTHYSLVYSLVKRFFCKSTQLFSTIADNSYGGIETLSAVGV